MLPGGAGGDDAGGGAVLDAGAKTLFAGRLEDNKADGGAVLGAGVEAHGSARDAGVEAHSSAGGVVSEKKSRAELYALEIGRDKVLGSLDKPPSNLYGKWVS